MGAIVCLHVSRWIRVGMQVRSLKMPTSLRDIFGVSKKSSMGCSGRNMGLSLAEWG